MSRQDARSHYVEVIVREIIKEYTDFRRWLLELKKVVVAGLDGYRHQC
jgi:hypothetical protein